MCWLEIYSFMRFTIKIIIVASSAIVDIIGIIIMMNAGDSQTFQSQFKSFNGPINENVGFGQNRDLF